ncbi:nitroreductase [Sphingobium sp. B2D3A]|uniref:nitroreductase family protein n=1 Tax=unclassified Sphingobium TaxID=2611147 RepID=UPI002224322A|nr:MULTISPECIES: nitroreductase [unclassified Sphingobium]MCW2337851.1 nitroreductase [Sphingobium sp. B2D3A]MCW2384309.1 nitroreductase [Sphingobium sp. B2D3D]
MFNDRSSIPAYLASRRSGKPRDLAAPGPSLDQQREMVRIATRTPDHGKLAPWRFVIVPDDQREALASLLERAYLAEKPEAGRLEIEAMHQFAHQAPALIVILSSPKSSKIPVWEQELSVGAAAMNLLHAAHAAGFAGGWLTGWPSYNETVRDAFGTSEERIAGFVFIGTPSRDLDERPRPELDDVLSIWRGA